MAILGVLLGMTVLGVVIWFKRNRIRHWLFIEEAERSNVISSGELEIVREELAETLSTIRADIAELRSAIRGLAGQQTAILKAQKSNHSSAIEAINKGMTEQGTFRGSLELIEESLDVIKAGQQELVSAATAKTKPIPMRRQWSEDLEPAETKG